jgi:hypothetical protein
MKETGFLAENGFLETKLGGILRCLQNNYHSAKTPGDI